MACIQVIAYFRNWADCVLHVPWDGREEANQAINQQRRDAYWVLKNSIPLRTDYHHLATGLKRGDAHALYTKIHKLFLKATAKNRGKIRKEFYNLSMASTKLNVTKFAAKVVQLAEDLEAVGGKLDQDEVVTRFLNGLAKKFDQIVTVENVSKNPFDTTLKNVVSFADDNNLLEYRETSVHGHYHMAKDTRSPSSFNPPRSNHGEKKKPHYKKKVKPSPQYKRWSSSSSSSNFGSSGGSGQQRQSTFQQRNPSHTQRRVNFNSRDTRPEQKYEQKHDNHTTRAPYLCMMRAESGEPAAEPGEPAAAEPVTHEVPTIALSTEIRKLIDIVVVKHLEHIYNRLNTLKNNATQGYNNQRDIANQNIDAINKLKLQVDQLNDKVSKHLPKTTHPEEDTTTCSFETSSTYSYLCMAQDIGRERVENKHEERKELPVLERICIYPGCSRPCHVDQNGTHDYCGRTHAITAPQMVAITRLQAQINRQDLVIDDMKERIEFLERMVRVQEAPVLQRRVRRRPFPANQEHLFFAVQDRTHTSSQRELEAQSNYTQLQEEWMLDSGATYHLATNLQDFDKGSLEQCSIELRLGNDNKMMVQWKGKCTRQTNTKTTIVMRNVLYAPEYVSHPYHRHRKTDQRRQGSLHTTTKRS